MKTKIVFALCIMMCLLGVSRMKAQVCPYTITNGHDCTISVKIEFFTNCSSSACYSSPAISIPAGSSQSFGCQSSCSGQLCDVKVTLLNIGGYTISGGSGYVNKGHTLDNGSTPACDGVSGNSYSINWWANWASIQP